MRKGEILGLKFSDFDFEKNTVRRSRQIVANPKLSRSFNIEEYSLIEREPKTENSYRILRVPKAVMDEVERRQRKVQLDKEYAGEKYRDNGYVCCRGNGRPPS